LLDSLLQEIQQRNPKMAVIVEMSSRRVH